jgi:hypothetical protein
VEDIILAVHTGVYAISKFRQNQIPKRLRAFFRQFEYVGSQQCRKRMINIDFESA